MITRLRRPRTLKTVSLVLVMLMVLGLGPSPALAIDFKTSAEQPLQDIFETLAKFGQYNVIVDPSLRTQKMKLNLKKVDPLEAMYLVANIHGLKVKKVSPESKTPPTYAVARPDTIEKGFEQGFNRSLRLRYAKAEEVAQVLTKGLGKDVNINVDVHKPTNALILQGTEDILQKVENLVRDLDLPVPQVVLDAKVVEIQSKTGSNLGFRWDFGVGQSANGKVTANGSGSVVALTEYQRQQLNGNFYDTPSPAKGSDFFKFGDFFRANLFFNASLEALETQGLTRVLAAPRLLAINGKEAQLNIGDKIVFSGGPSQPPEERDTGTEIRVTPRVNKDNQISMEISVQQSTATFERPDFPTINRTFTKTEVQVRDGEEVLVGGLVTENNQSASENLPFLGSLPLIKHLFKNKTERKSSRELVILITPRVVQQQFTGEVTEAPVGTGGKAGPDGGLGDLPGLDDLDVGGPNAKASPTPGPSPANSKTVGKDGGGLDGLDLDL